MVRVVKKPEERKEEIVLAACRLFLDKGYENTTMRDVMAVLDIAKGTIYHYFASKDDLLEAVIAHIAGQQLERQRKVLSGLRGNALQRLEQYVHASTHHEEEYAEVIDHLHKPANAGMHIRLLAMHITLQAPLYAELIRQGCEEGLFSAGNPLETAEFLLAGIRFLTDMGVSPWTDGELARRAQAFPAIVESLLQAPAGSFAFLLRVLR
jgi:AcrR family transcriptional regulator